MIAIADRDRHCDPRGKLKAGRRKLEDGSWKLEAETDMRKLTDYSHCAG
jgi:hypothetical protein